MKRPRYRPVMAQRAAAYGPRLRAATARGGRKVRVQPAQRVQPKGTK